MVSDTTESKRFDESAVTALSPYAISLFPMEIR
jgi:hypothetical protein